MKTVGKLLILCAFLIWGRQIFSSIISKYEYERAYGQSWELADKSSTIATKQRHIAEFVQKLEEGHRRGDFSKHNAIFLKTGNNEFDKNLIALKTLSDRLSQIQGMDPSSFEYNTAIQQITAQEQGEARAMLEVFTGCYTLRNYFLCWRWVGPVAAFCATLICLIGAFMWIENKD